MEEQSSQNRTKLSPIQNMEQNQSMDAGEPKTQPPNQSQKLINGYKQGCSIFVLIFTLYICIAVVLHSQISPYWVWAEYLAPIAFVQLLVLTIIFIILVESINENERSDENRDEECFCSISIALPLLLISWPVFTIVYFFIYNDILSVRPELVQSVDNSYGMMKYMKSITFQSENYTILIMQLNDQSLGYGCISSNYQCGLTTFGPMPFLSYILPDDDLPNFITKGLKLPTWFCTDHINVTKNQHITNKLYKTPFRQGDVLQYQDGSKAHLVIFDSIPYVPQYAFALFVGFQYIQMWFFSSIIIFVVVLLYDTNHVQENQNMLEKIKRISRPAYTFDLEEAQSPVNSLNIARPSRFKRGMCQLLSFTQAFSLLTYCMTLDINQTKLKIVISILLVVPGFMLLIYSFTSRFHQYPLQLITNLYKELKKQIEEGLNQSNCLEQICYLLLVVISPLILMLLWFIYCCICIFFSFYLINMRTYLSRHFVSAWYDDSEVVLSEQKYNQYVNYLFILDWVWQGVIIMIFLLCCIVYGTINAIFFITLVATTIQFFLFPISFFNRTREGYLESTNFLWVSKIAKSKVTFINEELHGMNHFDKLQFNCTEPRLQQS